MQNIDWQLPPDYSEKFLDACYQAATNDEAFATFQTTDPITTIIENTSQDWADRALHKMGFTPTMIRYFYTCGLIEKLLGHQYGNNVVEIGGGYGGMCRLMHMQFGPPYYYIFDLPEVTMLQKRYLDQYAIRPTFKTNPETIGRIDLCISWCGWSELSLPLREEYFEKVIQHCNHIFICSNYNTQEDIAILSRKFDVKTYSDGLVSNVLYA